jgi:hypothetical protein
MTQLHATLEPTWSACEAARRDLLAVLDRITPVQWLDRGGAGGWTIAQQVDHLRRSEVGTSKMARKLIRGDFDGIVRPAQARLFDSGLDVYPYGRLPAPEGLEPTDLAFGEAREQLAAVHARFLEELQRFQGPDPEALAAPDPATAVWFTLGGWVRLQALHEEHHLAQVWARLSS